MKTNKDKKHYCVNCEKETKHIYQKVSTPFSTFTKKFCSVCGSNNGMVF